MQGVWLGHKFLLISIPERFPSDAAGQETMCSEHCFSKGMNVLTVSQSLLGGALARDAGCGQNQ